MLAIKKLIFHISSIVYNYAVIRYLAIYNYNSYLQLAYIQPYKYLV